MPYHEAELEAAAAPGEAGVPSRCGGEETTALLRGWAEGDRVAGEQLLERLYPELRGLALSLLRSARSELSFQASDLLHESYLRISLQRSDWRNRSHFFALAARLMRRTLLDLVKERRRLRRGGTAVRIQLHAAELHEAGSERGPIAHPDLLDLDRALRQLAEVSASAARVVELRYFGGLTLEETAAVLDVSRATVARRWRFARAWLFAALEAER